MLAEKGFDHLHEANRTTDLVLGELRKELQNGRMLRYVKHTTNLAMHISPVHQSRKYFTLIVATSGS